MKTLQSRNQFPHLLKDMGLVGAAAFIGVAEGDWEFSFLQQWPGNASLIDVWKILDAPGYSGHGEDTDIGQETRYQRIIKKARTYGGRCQVMRATSEEAAPKFKDGSLVFCYLDANHIRAEIEKDLRLWFPKLAPKSVFAGHDHLDGLKAGVDYGVKTAVANFAQEHGLTVHSTGESDYPSWYIIR